MDELKRLDQQYFAVAIVAIAIVVDSSSFVNYDDDVNE
jgi:hypothetical protein